MSLGLYLPEKMGVSLKKRTIFWARVFQHSPARKCLQIARIFFGQSPWISVFEMLRGFLRNVPFRRGFEPREDLTRMFDFPLDTRKGFGLLAPLRRGGNELANALVMGGRNFVFYSLKLSF